MVSFHFWQSPILKRTWGNEFAKNCSSHTLLPAQYGQPASCLLVQLSLRALVADPMHQLFDAKGGVMRIQAVLRLVFIVPFTQQLVFCCFVCWLGSLLSKRFVNATRTSAVIPHTLCNFSLPLMIPVSCLSRCFGSKRAVLTYCFPLTVWAFPASNYKSASTQKVSWAGSRRCADCAELLVKLLRSNTLTKFSVKFAQNCNLVCWSCLGP